MYHMHVSRAIFSMALHFRLSVKNNLLSVSQDVSHLLTITANKEGKKRTKNIHNYVKWKHCWTFLCQYVFKFHAYEIQRKMFLVHACHSVYIIQNFHSKGFQDHLKVNCWDHVFFVLRQSGFWWSWWRKWRSRHFLKSARNIVVVFAVLLKYSKAFMT
jgi:hypothetical protein